MERSQSFNQTDFYGNTARLPKLNAYLKNTDKDDSHREKFAAGDLSERQRKDLGISEYYRPYTLSIKKSGVRQRVYAIAKRATDIVCATVALILLSPIMLLTALAIVLEDPKGGPIFKQKRTGRNGKEFNLLKFRSMCVDAEAKLNDLLRQNEFNGKAFKIKDDPRITKVGKIIRNCSIDELPQLINIIRGDMSIVGPRPPLPREVELYDSYEKQRLSVKPGLTCIWQVYPGRHEISFDDWVAMDLKYINERSYFGDWKLIFKTVLTVFRGNTD